MTRQSAESATSAAATGSDDNGIGDHQTSDPQTGEAITDEKVCGLVMPISDMDGYPPGHWSVVRGIVEDALRETKFTPRLVSEGGAAGMIPKRIIRNLHDNPIVICDISGKNPNVMFELGMRLAFDKAAVLIKDHRTEIPFDMAWHEYIDYSEELRYDEMEDFKARLAKKVCDTFAPAEAVGANYSPYLRDFELYGDAKRTQMEMVVAEVITHFEKISQNVIDKISQKIAAHDLGRDGFVLLKVGENAARLSENAVRLSMEKSPLSHASDLITDNICGDSSILHMFSEKEDLKSAVVAAIQSMTTR